MSSDIPRLVLHCGIHKTGTTTLQVALESLRAQLRAHGVALITISQMKKMQHDQGWAAYRKGPHLKSPLWTAEFRTLVTDEMAAVERESGRPADQVLVTNERMVGARMPSTVDHPIFRPLAERAIGQVLASLEPDEVHVALYTRRQDRLIESCYLWEVQKGLSHTVREQFPFIDEPVMRFSELAERLTAIPGVSSIRVRPFETIAAGSLAYLDDFLGNVGLQGALDLSVFDGDPSANRSYSQKALDVALALNPFLETNKQRNATRQFLKQAFPVGRHPAAAILSEEERLHLIDIYRDDNERLFRTWMPDLPADSYSTLEGTDKLRDVLSGLSLG